DEGRQEDDGKDDPMSQGLPRCARCSAKANRWVRRTQSRYGRRASEVRVAGRSITVLIRLIRAVDRHANIGRLLVRQFRQLDADLGEMEPRDLLVEALRQGVNFFLVLPPIGPQLDLRQRLVGE